jgi:hypothetical protein
VLVAAALVVLVAVVLHQQDEIRADCKFFRPVAMVIPVNSPGGDYPSRLGVQIVASARIAYNGHGCSPSLPPPSARLLQDEAHYGIR